MKKLWLAAATILIALTAFYTINHHNAGTPPLLVKDNEDTTLPKRFRTMQDAKGKGLEKLRASASGAFSARQLEAVKQKAKAKHITVVDLRQESHIFINDEAVSWYGTANAANKGKTQETIIADEASKLAAIKALTHIDIAHIKDKSGGMIKAYSPIPTKVEKVQTEGKLVRELGLDYLRFTVRDHAMPTPAQVDGYIKLIRDLPKDHWLHVHCRGGKGRTTTFLAIYDMMENAKEISMEDILARQHKLGGSDLFEEEKEEYKKADIAARQEFIKHFYRYAKENNDGFKTLWTEWVKVNHHHHSHL